ncbi:leukocidin family pore-forming toxin [Kistimonas asteriae]|uniref:leukocidin family pore-forming toxin n=1 Tax=Kistimonas asteriae TaxID=517724 RepID=UPI001BA95A96|nr:leukocidin family pore-forming toxin [Kistimonas asteriae]
MKGDRFRTRRFIPLPLILACSGLPMVLPETVQADYFRAMPASSHAPVITTLGALPDLSLTVIQNRGWQASPVSYQDNDWSSVSLLVVNASLPISKSALSQAQDALTAGVPILIDGSTSNDADKQQRVSASIGGIGLSDPVILVRKRDGVPEYRVLSITSEQEEFSSSDNEASVIMNPAHQLSDAQLSLLADETDELLREWFIGDEASDLRHRRKAGVTTASAATQPPFKPETTIPLEFRYVGNRCMVGKKVSGWDWSDETIDACNGKMSIALFYSIDLIRSTPYSGGGDKNADDAKLVRFTLNPQQSGGAGWHLVKSPSHKHTWFQSWTNRDTWFGPIAMKYGTDIRSNDPALRLYQHTPDNTPRHKTISEETGFTVGVAAEANAEIGKEGPKAGGSVSANFSYSSNRTVEYEVHEYSVENQSSASGSGDRASWLWDRKYDQHHKDWVTHVTAPLWGSDWLWKNSEFTAVAHANFKPGMSATFRAPANKRGSSRLTLENHLTVVALGGKVVYSALYQTYVPGGYKGTQYTFRKNIQINWDSPVFDPEVPVSLEPFRYDSDDGLCLDVTGSATADSSPVGVYRCHYRNNQLWGIDDEQRYRSKVAPDRCLEVAQDDTLVVCRCDASARQKWRWKDDKLINELGKKLALVNGKPVVSDNPAVYSDWKNYIHRVEATDALVIY